MKHALVVGGTGGIGSRLVERLCADGDDVVFTYFRARSDAEALAKRLADQGHRATPVRADISRPRALEPAVEACGPAIDIVMVAAASGVWGPLAGMRQRHVEWAFEVNATALVELFSLVLPRMRDVAGSMVVLTSFLRPRASSGRILSCFSSANR